MEVCFDAVRRFRGQKRVPEPGVNRETLFRVFCGLVWGVLGSFETVPSGPGGRFLWGFEGVLEPYKLESLFCVYFGFGLAVFQAI